MHQMHIILDVHQMQIKSAFGILPEHYIKKKYIYIYINIFFFFFFIVFW